MKHLIAINKELTLRELQRTAMFEGLDIEINNGKAYAVVEIFQKHDFIDKR